MKSNQMIYASAHHTDWKKVESQITHKTPSEVEKEK
jgi:hypothetical protein